MTVANMSGEAALVTGAASGVGRAVALKLAEAGANLFLTDVNEGALAETAALLARSGREVVVETLDLADGAACKAMVDKAAEHFGRLDALCNVAGLIYLANTPEMAPELYRRVIDVNLSAPFYLSQAAIPHLLKTEGAIVNVSSTAAFVGEAYVAAYCASKAGMLGMTRAMAMEYLKQPIRINAVAPGGMNTNIAANFRPPAGADPELLMRYRPIRGLVEVDDVADVVVMLASDAGRGFHGACITLDAGQTAG